MRGDSVLPQLLPQCSVASRDGERYGILRCTVGRIADVEVETVGRVFKRDQIPPFARDDPCFGQVEPVAKIAPWHRTVVHIRPRLTVEEHAAWRRLVLVLVMRPLPSEDDPAATIESAPDAEQLRLGDHRIGSCRLTTAGCFLTFGSLRRDGANAERTGNQQEQASLEAHSHHGLPFGWKKRSRCVALSGKPGSSPMRADVSPAWPPAHLHTASHRATERRSPPSGGEARVRGELMHFGRTRGTLGARPACHRVLQLIPVAQDTQS